MIKRIVENLDYSMPVNNRVGYIGWLGYGNLGDEIIYQSFKENFKRMKVVKFKYTDKIMRYERIIKRKIYNAVFLGGGTLIFASGEMADFMRIAVSNYKNAFVFGAGVRNPEFWEGIKRPCNCYGEWCEVLNKCKYVGVRGPLSKSILEERQVGNVDVVGDPALFYINNNIVKKKGNKRIGLNIGLTKKMMWGNEESVAVFMERLVRYLLDSKWEIKFFPVCKNDIGYIHEVIKKIGVQIDIFEGYHSIDKSIEFMSECDMFIGEKLHSVIIAMCAHTPSIMLEYRPKCRDFMMSMGLEKYNIKTNELSLDKIAYMINEIEDNTYNYQLQIDTKAKMYKSKQIEMADKISKIILSD